MAEEKDEELEDEKLEDVEDEEVDRVRWDISIDDLRDILDRIEEEYRRIDEERQQEPPVQQNDVGYWLNVTKSLRKLLDHEIIFNYFGGHALDIVESLDGNIIGFKKSLRNARQLLGAIPNGYVKDEIDNPILPTEIKIRNKITKMITQKLGEYEQESELLSMLDDRYNEDVKKAYMEHLFKEFFPVLLEKDRTFFIHDLELFKDSLTASPLVGTNEDIEKQFKKFSEYNEKLQALVIGPDEETEGLKDLPIGRFIVHHGFPREAGLIELREHAMHLINGYLEHRVETINKVFENSAISLEKGSNEIFNRATVSLTTKRKGNTGFYSEIYEMLPSGSDVKKDVLIKEIVYRSGNNSLREYFQKRNETIETSLKKHYKDSEEETKEIESMVEDFGKLDNTFEADTEISRCMYYLEGKYHSQVLSGTDFESRLPSKKKNKNSFKLGIANGLLLESINNKTHLDKHPPYLARVSDEYISLFKIIDEFKESSIDFGNFKYLNPKTDMKSIEKKAMEYLVRDAKKLFSEGNLMGAIKLYLISGETLTYKELEMEKESISDMGSKSIQESNLGDALAYFCIAEDDFRINRTAKVGKIVPDKVHSSGRLLPHKKVIDDLDYIYGLDYLRSIKKSTHSDAPPIQSFPQSPYGVDSTPPRMLKRKMPKRTLEGQTLTTSTPPKRRVFVKKVARKTPPF